MVKMFWKNIAAGVACTVVVFSGGLFAGCGSSNAPAAQSATAEQAKAEEAKKDAENKAYAEALELAKAGKWAECEEKISSFRGTSTEPGINYLLEYANAQKQFGYDTEEGYIAAAKSLASIPTDFDWPFKESLKEFKAAATEGHVRKKQEREEAEAEARRPPLEIMRIYMSRNSIDVPEINIRVRNTKDRVIDAFEVNVIAFDAYDRKVSRFGDGVFNGISQSHTISPGQSRLVTWTLHELENGRKFKLTLISVHFTDGTVWRPSSDQDVSQWAKF